MYASCRHIKSDGIRCQSPAMRQSDFCYFHVKLHTSTRGVERRKLKYSDIEDTAGIRTAVVQTLNALIGKRIDAKQAGLALYGIQIIAQKINDDRSSPRETVREIIRSKKGDELAPELCVKEQGWGKSYEDCSECPHRETCSELAEKGGAKNLTAARDEHRSPQTSGQRRPTTFKDATAANHNQVIESMSPVTLLSTFLKLGQPAPTPPKPPIQRT